MNAKSKTLITAWTVGLLTAVSSQLYAQPSAGGGGVPMKMNITLSGALQEADTDNGTVHKWPVFTAKGNFTQQIIEKVYNAAGAGTPPSGAQLMLNPDGSVDVTDSKGNVLQDASSIISVSLASDSNTVWSGQSSDTTGQEIFTGQYISTLTYADPVATITFTGLTTEKFTVSARDNSGKQTGKDSISWAGVGSGTLEDNAGNQVTGVLTFSFTASGSGTIGQ